MLSVVEENKPFDPMSIRGFCFRAAMAVATGEMEPIRPVFLYSGSAHNFVPLLVKEVICLNSFRFNIT